MEISRPPQAVVPSNLTVSAQEKPEAATAQKTFRIPIAPSTKVEVANAGKLTTENLSSVPARSLSLGGKVDVADKVAGKRISQEAIDVLAGAFKKSGDDYVYSTSQIDAAKRELLRFWGFPEKFVKEHGAEMRINQIDGTDSALDANGKLTGVLGNRTFEGWIDRNDDWNKADIQDLVSSFEPPKAATHLEPSDAFFERNGVAPGPQRQEVTDRLLKTLTNWLTADDKDIAWAKQMLTTGYAIKGNITTLQGFAEGKSAIDEEQSVRGSLTHPDGTKRSFTLELHHGVLLDMPEGDSYSIKVTSPDT